MHTGRSTKPHIEPAAELQPTASSQSGMAERVNASPRMAAQRRQLQHFLGTATDSQHQSASDALAAAAYAPLQKKAAASPAKHGGLPDGLKAGVESLSGMSMDHVKVHYNSSQPAQLHALAYAQGSDIHLAPGQEKHLPHEAWHVVQQAQGRVQPTMQAKGIGVNDDARLEREADVMGQKAARGLAGPREGKPAPVVSRAVAQCARYKPDDQVILDDGSEGIVQEVLEDGGNVEVNSIYRVLLAERSATVLSTQINHADTLGERLVSAMSLLDAKWGGGVFLGGAKRIEARKPFYQWLYQDGPIPKEMNCWEGILLAACMVGVLNKEQISGLIQRVNPKDASSPPVLMGQITFTGQIQGDRKADWSSVNIPVGNVIVWGDGLHFALSAGGIHCIQVDKNAARRSTVPEITRECPAYGDKLIQWGTLFRQ